MDILQQGIIRFEPGIIEKEGSIFILLRLLRSSTCFIVSGVHVIFAVRRTACAENI